MKQIEDPYENLANAIILQAAKDYRKALGTLKNNPKSYAARRLKKEVEKFFLSSWFVELTDLDGEVLMQDLRKEADWHDE